MKLFSQIEFDGAVHGEDTPYLFYANIPMMKAPEINSKEFGLIKKMVSIVTSFIISGDPNSFEDLSWEPTTSSNPLMCLNMTNDLFEMIPLPEESRLRVLDEILAEAGVPSY